MINWKTEWRKLLAIVVVFLVFFWLPVNWSRFTGGIMEALHLAKWYAQEHVLLCLVPAFFIAGAIGVFVSQASVMKYLGAKANKVLAYAVAAGSGTILAVCSCTILPLFTGIYRMGAGLGPAIVGPMSSFVQSSPPSCDVPEKTPLGDRPHSRPSRHLGPRRVEVAIWHLSPPAPSLPRPTRSGSGIDGPVA